MPALAVHFRMMKRTDTSAKVGLSELREELGKLVDLAASGQEIVITDRGRPVARLMPIESPLEELIRQGHARPPNIDASELKKLGPPIKARGTVSDLVRR